MELKVWVEGIQRIVCGVTNTTTCQDVVYALAHATGKTGRFTLIERWRNSEKLLAPHEHPLKILLKWGEYASDVQFILQRTALEPRPEIKNDIKFAQGQQIYGRTPTLESHSNSSQSQTHNIMQEPAGIATGENSLLRPAPNSPLQNRDIKKSLTFSGGHSSHLSAQATNENVSSSSEVGAKPGFNSQSMSSSQQYPSPIFFEQGLLGSPVQSFSNRPYYKTSAPRFSSSLTRPPAPPPYELVKGNPPPPTPCFRNQPLNTYGCYTSKERYSPSMFGRSPPLYPSRAPMPNMVGNRHPRELPPYRDPPPPPPPSHPALMKISPQCKINNQTSSSFDPDNSSERHNMAYDASSRNPNTCYPESSTYQDGIECNLTSSKDPLKLISSNKDDIASKHVYSSSDKVKKDKRITPESSSVPLVNNHNSSPSKRTGFNSNTSMGKLTSPIKSSTAVNNKDIITNSVSGDINENMIGSLSNSMEKNNRNQVSGSHLPNNMHKGNPLKGKDGERSYVKDMIKQLVSDSNKDSPHGILEQKSEQVVVDNYYRELVRLVNQQREKISAQQIDLTKYEAEIAFTEGYCKEEESRLNYIKAEIQRLENVSSDSADNSSQVKYSIEELEEQLKEAQASENEFIEDVANIKKKISNYDQQLGQMKNKICTLQEVLDQEEALQKLNLSERAHGEEQGAIMREIEKLQSAINQSTNQADYAQDVSQQLSQELHEADARLTEKKNEIEKLKEAMREANMEALAMMPVEELKAPSDKTGIAKNGTSRRMKGSPRQLETAVPTSKNPHGVWV